MLKAGGWPVTTGTLIVGVIALVLAFCVAEGSRGALVLTLVTTPTIVPFFFVLAHLMYFGPVFAFVLLSWRWIARAMPVLGLGFAGAFVAHLAFLITTESRHGITVLPFFALLIGMYAHERASTWRRLTCFLGVFAFFPRAWLPFGSTSVALAAWVRAWDPYKGSIHPEILKEIVYFLHHGPWIYPYTGMLLASLNALVCVALTYCLLRCPQRA